MYVKVENGSAVQYPYSIKDLKSDNPNISFPRSMSADALEGYGVYEVAISSAPDYSEKTQKIMQNAVPNLENGSWVLGWTVSSKTQEEIAEYDSSVALDNRIKRNNLLTDTDWQALSDVTMSAEMTAYRQALRDITAHANWPHLNDDDWPTKP